MIKTRSSVLEKKEYEMKKILLKTAALLLFASLALVGLCSCAAEEKAGTGNSVTIPAISDQIQDKFKSDFGGF